MPLPGIESYSFMPLSLLLSINFHDAFVSFSNPANPQRGAGAIFNLATGDDFFGGAEAAVLIETRATMPRLLLVGLASFFR